MKAELDQLRNELAQFQSAKVDQPGGGPEAPNEDDYDTYGDYLDAKTEYAIAKALSQQQGNQQEQQLTPEQAQQAKWVEERVEVVAEQAAELAEQAPDFMQVMQENADILDSFEGTELERVALSLDNTAAAIYNLAKAGRLEAVAAMPVHLAAVELHNAQNTPVKAPVKKVSGAPKPIRAQSGSGTKTTNALGSKSTDELLEWAGYK